MGRYCWNLPHLLQDFSADLRVLFDQSKLFVAQPPGFLEYVIRNTDFADVVEFGADPNDFKADFHCGNQRPGRY